MQQVSEAQECKGFQLVHRCNLSEKTHPPEQDSWCHGGQARSTPLTEIGFWERFRNQITRGRRKFIQSIQESAVHFKIK